MHELEIFESLGILLDPEENRLPVDNELRQSIERLSEAFFEMTTQRLLYGTLNPDLWLEFIPWHSLN